MPKDIERKLYGMPRVKKGRKYLVIKTSKLNKWIIRPLIENKKK